jgi:outer membrane protein TolC
VRHRRKKIGHFFMVFSPRFDLRASYTRWEHKTFPDLSFGSFTVPSSSAFPQLLNNYGLSASVEIAFSDYLWKIPALYTLAKQSHRVQLARERSELERFAWVAAELYLATLRDASASEVNDAAAITLKQRAERMKALQMAGEDITLADVMRLKAEAARAEAQAAYMRGQMQSDRLRLAYMMNANPEDLKLTFDVHQLPQPLDVTVEEALVKCLSEAAERFWGFSSFLD